MEPSRIVVLPGFGLGDAVFTIPALRALAARFPEARLTILGAPWLQELVGPPRGPAHAVVPVPDALRRWLQAGEGWAEPELEAFLERCRRARFDLAVQLFGGGRTSNPLVAAMGAETAIGLRAAGAPPLDLSVPYVYWQSEVVRHLEVVRLVGAAPVELDPSLVVGDADRAEAAELTSGIDRRFALLVPGAGDARRRWPTVRFAAVADGLGALGLAVAVVGTTDDGVLAEAVANLAHVPVLDLTGRTSIGGLIGLAASAAVVVGNDTGPTHVAAAVGAPTVAIFWAGNLINGGRLFRSRYRPVLSWRLACPICGRSTTEDRCSHDPSFVDGVAVEEVLDAVADLLAE